MAESDRLMRVMYGMTRQSMTVRERVRFFLARVATLGRKARGSALPPAYMADAVREAESQERREMLRGL